MRLSWVSVPVVAVTAAVGLLAAAAPASAADPVFRVTALDGSTGQHGWNVDTPSTPAIDAFADSTGEPGSLKLFTPATADKAAATAPLVGGAAEPTTLQALTYQTYTVTKGTNNDQQQPSVQLGGFCDATASTGYIRFNYEQIYGQQAGVETQKVQTGTWQTWDAYKKGQAIWYTRKYLSATPGGGISNTQDATHTIGGDQAGGYLAYATLLAAFKVACPAGKLGQIALNQGSGNPGLTGYTDRLDYKFGTTGELVNFALTKAPSSSSAASSSTNGSSSSGGSSSDASGVNVATHESGSGGLASTGKDTRALITIMLGLLVSGASLLMLGRRRYARRH